MVKEVKSYKSKDGELYETIHEAEQADFHYDLAQVANYYSNLSRPVENFYVGSIIKNPRPLFEVLETYAHLWGKDDWDVIEKPEEGKSTIWA